MLITQFKASLVRNAQILVARLRSTAYNERSNQASLKQANAKGLNLNLNPKYAFREQPLPSLN